MKLKSPIPFIFLSLSIRFSLIVFEHERKKMHTKESKKKLFSRKSFCSCFIANRIHKVMLFMYIYNDFKVKYNFKFIDEKFSKLKCKFLNSSF